MTLEEYLGWLAYYNLEDAKNDGEDTTDEQLMRAFNIGT
jgi:hypothetical protein